MYVSQFRLAFTNFQVYT